MIYLASHKCWPYTHGINMTQSHHRDITGQSQGNEQILKTVDGRQIEPRTAWLGSVHAIHIQEEEEEEKVV